MGMTGCSEISVRNYHSSPRKIPKERRFQHFQFTVADGPYVCFAYNTHLYFWCSTNFSMGQWRKSMMKSWYHLVKYFFKHDLNTKCVLFLCLRPGILWKSPWCKSCKRKAVAWHQSYHQCFIQTVTIQNLVILLHRLEPRQWTWL
jgi:hypothetical protein